jgi:hypothetical protein
LSSCYLGVADREAVQSEYAAPGNLRQWLGVDQRSVEVEDHPTRSNVGALRTNVLNKCRKHDAGE